MNLKHYKKRLEKIKEIEKLYGAAHFYFWNQNGLSDSNIDWPKLREQINSPCVQSYKRAYSKE